MAYQSNTQEFWNSCVAMAGKSDYRVGGSFFDGKGQRRVAWLSYHTLQRRERHQHSA